jgi:hypothetical protein
MARNAAVTVHGASVERVEGGHITRAVCVVTRVTQLSRVRHQGFATRSRVTDLLQHAIRCTGAVVLGGLAIKQRIAEGPNTLAVVTRVGGAHGWAVDSASIAFVDRLVDTVTVRGVADSVGALGVFAADALAQVDDIARPVEAKAGAVVAHIVIVRVGADTGSAHVIGALVVIAAIEARVALGADGNRQQDTFLFVDLVCEAKEERPHAIGSQPGILNTETRVAEEVRVGSAHVFETDVTEIAVVILVALDIGDTFEVLADESGITVFVLVTLDFGDALVVVVADLALVAVFVVDALEAVAVDAGHHSGPVVRAVLKVVV